ncbi:MAG: hypothetical protein ACHREM_14855, partial [Polyangiales bacterium]
LVDPAHSHGDPECVAEFLAQEEPLTPVESFQRPRLKAALEFEAMLDIAGLAASCEKRGFPSIEDSPVERLRACARFAMITGSRSKRIAMLEVVEGMVLDLLESECVALKHLTHALEFTGGVPWGVCQTILTKHGLPTIARDAH